LSKFLTVSLLTLVLFGTISPSYAESLSETSLSDEDILLIAENEKKRNLRLSRQDQIPKERLKEETASYLEGYIQALIDANYHELNVLVYVNKDGVVFLYNLPKDDRIRNSIIEFVKDLPDVVQVKEADLDHAAKERIGNLFGK